MLRLGICLWILMGAVAIGREVAITFDDTPMPGTAIFGRSERVETLLKKLEKQQVTAAFFCIGDYADSEEGSGCLTKIAEAGHFLANHSYHHLHTSELSLAEFSQEVAKTDALLSIYPTYRRWFRFPYLDYGNRVALGGSQGKLMRAFASLARQGYSHGFVTLNTFDWYLNSKIGILPAEVLKEVYLTLLAEWIEGCAAQWNISLPHVLLLHQNDLNALYMEDVIALLHQQGWTLVSPEQAFDKRVRYSLARLCQDHTTPPSLSTDYIDRVIERVSLK